MNNEYNKNSIQKQLNVDESEIGIERIIEKEDVDVNKNDEK
jgi:hypothetical protein